MEEYLLLVTKWGSMAANFQSSMDRLLSGSLGRRKKSHGELLWQTMVVGMHTGSAQRLPKQQKIASRAITWNLLVSNLGLSMDLALHVCSPSGIERHLLPTGRPMGPTLPIRNGPKIQFHHVLDLWEAHYALVVTNHSLSLLFQASGVVAPMMVAMDASHSI